jgi:protein TonB
VFSGQHVTEYGAASGLKKSTSADNAVNLGAYLSDLEAKVNERAPHKFLGQVVINFHIEKNGSITGLKLLRSSGMQQIDATALDAIKGSAPFPPISSGVGKDVQYTFDSTSAGTRGHGIFK